MNIFPKSLSEILAVALSLLAVALWLEQFFSR